MEEKPKKPIYKRVWFWLLMILVVFPAASKAIDAISDAASPAESMINEERVAEQAKVFEEMQQAEQSELTGESSASAEEEIIASVESLISDMFCGEHYACTVEPYEDDFGYALTLSVEVPESYADNPDTILGGLGNTIASQSDSRLVWLTLLGWYDDEKIYESTGYFNERLSIADTPENTSSSSTSSGNSNSESYVVNTNTNVFHRSSCSYVDKIDSANKSYFSGTRTGAKNAGYSPCDHCDP